MGPSGRSLTLGHGRTADPWRRLGLAGCLVAAACAILSLVANALLGWGQWWMPGLWIASLPASAVVLLLLSAGIAARLAIGPGERVGLWPVLAAIGLLALRITIALPPLAPVAPPLPSVAPDLAPSAGLIAMMVAMGQTPTACLLAIGLADLLLRAGWPKASQLAAFCALAIAADAAFCLVDGLPLDYVFIGPSTALAAACLAAAVLLGSVSHGLMRALTAGTQAGVLARRLLAVSTVMIFVTCWLVSHRMDQVRDRALLVDQAGAILAMTWLLVSVSSVLADRIDGERLAAERSLELASTTDGLTGLLSRHRMRDLTLRATREQRRTAFINVDLDRFRMVGGPIDGDAILVEVARRLEAVAREHPLARLGGDQFGILYHGADPEQALQCGEAVLAAIGRPLETGGRIYHLRASVGVAQSDQVGDTDLQQAADDAMYVAKRRGGNQIALFEGTMHESRAQQVVLEAALHAAMAADDQLSMVYQPVIQVADGAVVAVEALARWTHPELGPIGPDMFIPFAESTGLIDRLGEKLMTEVVRQAALWHARLSGFAPVINLNISPVQFASGDVVGELARQLTWHGLPTRAFCIELTESAVTEEPAIRALKEARELGFRVAMDDFGIGYSSLAGLPRLPLTSVKLDRSFVTHAAEDAGDATLLRGIIGLAHGLGLKVVAEGVSTQAQFDLLADCGCDAAQGFLIARPMPAGDLEGWMEEYEAEGRRKKALLF